MSSPQEPTPGWAAPDGSGERQQQPAPAAPAGPVTPAAPAAPPAPPVQPAQPVQSPQSPQPAQPEGWGAPPVPPTWTQPQQQPPAWGAQPPTWTAQPPTAPAAPPPGAAPGYGPGYGSPSGPGYGSYGSSYGPGYGTPGYPAAPPAWAPPALQPGIVPLRPLSLGEILDGGVRAIRANPSVMFGLSAVAVTVAVLLSALLTYYVSGVLAAPLDDVTSTLSPDLSPTDAGQLTGQLSYGFSSVFSVPITSLVTTILTGLLVVSVSRSVLGRRISVREVLRSGRVWWVVGFSLLAGVVVVAAVALYVGLVLLVALGLHWNLGTVVLSVIGVVGFVVGVFWFATRTRLVTPALMLEGKGFWVTVKRAWRLTRGSFWRLFGIWLLVSVIMNVVAQLVAAPFAAVAVLVGGSELTSAASLAISSVGQVIALTASTTYTSAVVALLYIDVRMRREGLDIELGRAAAADAAAAVR